MMLCKYWMEAKKLVCVCQLYVAALEDMLTGSHKPEQPS